MKKKREVGHFNEWHFLFFADVITTGEIQISQRWMAMNSDEKKKPSCLCPCSSVVPISFLFEVTMPISFTWLNALFSHDLRFGLRRLCKSSGFTAVAVLSLALGIGGSTAIFSLLNGIVLKAVPYSQPQQLVWVWEDRGGHGLDKDRNSVSGGIFGQWSEQNRCFQQMAGVTSISLNLTGRWRSRAPGRGQSFHVLLRSLGDFFHSGSRFHPRRGQGRARAGGGDQSWALAAPLRWRGGCGGAR